MATARLYSTFILLLYLQGNYAQQALPNNQNVGVSSGVGLQQQTLQQMNAQSNINQIQNGGLNMNVPQQSNLQQPIANLPGNTQQPLGLTSSLQVQGSSVPVTNFQFTKQGLGQMASGFATKPCNIPPVPNSQCYNVGPKQNAQMSLIPQQPNPGPVNNAQLTQMPQQQNFGPVTNAQITQIPQQVNLGTGTNAQMTQMPQQQNLGSVINAQMTQIPQQPNLGPVSNAPVYQSQNVPMSSNPLAELAALKGLNPPLYSLFASQNNIQTQQNQQIPALNFNLGQSPLTDEQKQYLVRALQSQSVPQNQQGLSCGQAQWRMPGVDSQPITVYQGQPIISQQPQVIMAPPSQNQPAYITVQAQPLPAYPQNNPPIVVIEEEPSLMNLILSELQSDPLYGAYSPYQIQKRESKSSLKSLIPLIIKLLKDKNNCCNNNCGCPNNGCGNEMQVQSLLGQFTNPMSSQAVEQPIMAGKMVEPANTVSKTVEDPKKSDQTEKNDTDDMDSEESSEEDSSEFEDDSEEE